ncbi:MAG TPA: DUF2231 domain-containing protein [Usitatibacter sp.]|nr:DUF2231 domain-containing protein [Usitatibacter sp.]
MHTPASIHGHPIHAMLVPLAIGGFVISFVADIICLATGNLQPWSTIAYYTMLGAILAALAAALPGFIDMLSLPGGTPIKRTALTHMGINLTVVALFAWNAWQRHLNPENLGTPMLMSGIGILMLLVSGWLGGKMVYEAGVGVERTDGVPRDHR